jgi:hypothetical protein
VPGDVAGALTLWPEGEPPPSPSPTAAFQPLTDNEIIRILDVLPLNSMPKRSRRMARSSGAGRSVSRPDFRGNCPVRDRPERDLSISILCRKKECSFLKKRTKKLLIAVADLSPVPKREDIKVFCFLFFKKEGLAGA